MARGMKTYDDGFRKGVFTWGDAKVRANPETEYDKGFHDGVEYGMKHSGLTKFFTRRKLLQKIKRGRAEEIKRTIEEMEERKRKAAAALKNPAAAVQSRPDRGAPIALRQDRKLWEKVHGSARRIYNGDLSKFARRAADKVVADVPRFKSWGKKSRMPNPGTTVLLGKLIELHVLGSDGNIVMYVPKKPPPLLWSPGVRRDQSDGSLFAFTGMRVPNPEASCRASEAAELYKAWNAGEKEPRGMSRATVRRPNLSGAVPAIAVVYRSDKFTPRPVEYIHHFEEGVRCRTDGKIFYVTGGRLTLTERGLEK